MKTAFRVRHHLVFVEVMPEVYEYLLCAICPVNLTKPGLIC